VNTRTKGGTAKMIQKADVVREVRAMFIEDVHRQKFLWTGDEKYNSFFEIGFVFKSLLDDQEERDSP
jgi:hypothetical protein